MQPKRSSRRGCDVANALAIPLANVEDHDVERMMIDDVERHHIRLILDRVLMPEDARRRAAQGSDGQYDAQRSASGTKQMWPESKHVSTSRRRSVRVTPDR